MPLTLKKIVEKINELDDFEFAGEPVKVQYRSGIMTPEWEAKYKNKNDGAYGQAHDLIVEWDVLGDDGKPYPTDLDSLKQLPIEFIASLVGAIAGDLVPNRKTSRRSGASSFGA